MIEILDYSREEFSEELQLKLFHCGNARVDSLWHGEVICSAVSRLYYVKKSSFYIIINGQRIDFNKGNWYLVPAGSSYEFGCDTETEHLFFYFDLSGADRNDIFDGQTKVLSLSEYTEGANEISKLFGSNAAIDALSIKNTVMHILLKIIKKYKISIKNNKYSPCVIKAMDYINNNLSEKLTISTIANAIFVSESTLTKHIRQELSTSVNCYIDDLILTRAAQMITEGSLSLNAISEHFGFCDQFYFSRKFKAKFGLSPSEYKKSWNI